MKLTTHKSNLLLVTLTGFVFATVFLLLTSVAQAQSDVSSDSEATVRSDGVDVKMDSSVTIGSDGSEVQSTSVNRVDVRDAMIKPTDSDGGIRPIDRLSPDERSKILDRINSGPGNTNDGATGDANMELRRDEVADKLRERRDETTDRIMERKGELQDRREEAEDRREERREKLSEDRKKRIDALSDRIIRRTLAAVDRLEKIADRVESRVDKLETTFEGIDLSGARRLLSEARVKIDLAASGIGALELEIAAILESDITRDTMSQVRTLFDAVSQNIKDAHKALVAAIREVRAAFELRAELTVEADTNVGGSADGSVDVE